MSYNFETTMSVMRLLQSACLFFKLSALQKPAKLKQDVCVQPSQGPLAKIAHALHLSWAFTQSDIFTFVIPNTIFGVLGALSVLPGFLDSQPLACLEVFKRLPLVALFNWYMVLVFDLSNQRSEEAIREDAVNKPWRPIPAGKTTGDQARQGLLCLIPSVLLMNYLLGVWKEGVFILVLIWMNNDLKGGDDLLRDTILAAAYWLFNRASLHLAIGQEAKIGFEGYKWITLISCIVLTTGQVQDLRDLEGDTLNGRRTMPIMLGHHGSRAMIAGCVLGWSFLCAFLMQLPFLGYVITASMAIYLACRVILKTDKVSDRRNYRIWGVWIAVIYFSPVYSRLQMS